MRDQLLTEKIIAIRQELEVWAMENNVLKAGEGLVFSLRIERMVLVRCDNGEHFLEMKPAEFFSIKRLVDIGTPRQIASRITHFVVEDIHWDRFGSKIAEPIVTMREWLLVVHDTGSLNRIPGIGKTSVAWMKRLLNNSGLLLHDT